MKSSAQRYSLALFGMMLSISFVTVGLLTRSLSKAQSAPQEERGRPPWKVKVVGPQHPDKRAAKVDINAQTERIIENQIPFHIPIKVELNNLDKEPLLRHLQVKVTNTGSKPIYFLQLYVDLPKNLSEAGHALVCPLRYGRMEFIDLFEKVQPEDVPIRPGESYVFKIPKNNLDATESYLMEKGELFDLKLIYLYFSYVNFGDGTAFSGNTGTPLPNIHSEKSSRNSCEPVRKKAVASIDIVDSLPTRVIGSFLSHFSDSISLSKAGNSSVESPPSGSTCCPGAEYSSCYYRRETTYGCNYCGTGQTFESVGCTDPRGYCADSYTKDTKCTDSAGNTGICPEFILIACAPPFTGCYNAFQATTSSAEPDMFCEYCCGESPIIVDVQGNGYNLTNAQGGVNFDLNNDAVAERLSWTAAGSDDAFLALDRDCNGSIDNGAEVFGNFSAQPRSENPNGFASLAEFDKPAQGGNADGLIDSRDSVFNALRLWQDTNHNGVSEPAELHALAELQAASFSLNYTESPVRDRYGNRFRYRAPVAVEGIRGGRGRIAWDVYLVKQ